MKVCGIIAEYNPFHNGHLYQIRQIREQLNEAVPGAGSRRDLSAILTKLGNVRKSEKRYDEAGQFYLQALDMDKVLAEEVKSAQAWDDYAVSLVKTGDIHTAQGRYEDAASCYEEASGIFRKNMEKTRSRLFRDHYAGSCEKMAGVKKRTGDTQEAGALYREGIALREEMPFGAPMYDYDALYAALAKELPSAHMIDLLPALYGHSEYYFATDHHWTAEGAAQAYYEWRAAHGAEPDNQDSPTIITVSESFRGTLGSRVPSGLIPAERLKAFEVSGDITVEADGKEISLYDETALATKDKYHFFEGGNHGILTVTNHDVKDGGTLLILKDSFANSFLPCLVGDYARIIMIDERYAFMDIGQFALDSGADEIAVIREIISAG